MHSTITHTHTSQNNSLASNTPLSPPYPTSLWSGPPIPTATKFVENFSNSDMQLKHFVNENQRKDLLILDLRKQVSELLRYREQCSNLRAQVALVEEREKLREAEANTKNSELVERVRSLEDVESKLRGQNIRLEEEKSEVARKHAQQISDFHAQLAALRADAERREANMQKMEYELALSSKSSVSLQQQLQERERAHQVLLRQLKDQVTQLLAEKLTLEGQVTTLEAKLQYVQSVNKETQVMLENETSKRASVEKERDTLRGELVVLEGEISTRRQNNTTVATLQQEVQALLLFKEEAAHLRASLTVVEEEKKGLSEAIKHLEQQLNLHAQHNAEAIDFRSQLHEFKTKTEILNRELERSHILSSKLSEQVLKAQQKLGTCSTELHRVLLTARGAFGTTDLKQYGNTSAEIVDVMWVELHELLDSLCLENSTLKSRCAQMNIELESVSLLLQTRDTTIMNANLRITELEEVAKNKETLQASFTELKTQIAQLKAEQSGYLKYLQALHSDLDRESPQDPNSSYLAIL